MTVVCVFLPFPSATIFLLVSFHSFLCALSFLCAYFVSVPFVVFIQPFICLEFLALCLCPLLSLSVSADPFLVFAGEALCVMQGPSSATHHQRSSGNTVSRIPQPAVH